MCGITGIINKDGTPVDEALLRAMNDRIAHRGPDADGFYVDGAVGLGHRRLSILDLSERGRQPMVRRDRYWITYNGEVYNYLELRDELEALGHRFSSGTDTEVILAAYEEWGEECLARFNGMWAFAIYDSQERTVFLARDRYGIKPLYYCDEPGRILFGSEIKQLLLATGRAVANTAMVLQTLVTRYENHTAQTHFDGVLALVQGHCARIGLDDGSFRIRRWYELAVDPAVTGLSDDEAVERFRALFVDSVKLRLRSDVVVGTCLSGGLDSSSTSGVAAPFYREATGQPFIGIHAQSLEERSDESPWARRVAEDKGLTLHLVKPTTDDFLQTIDELVETQEEPFGSPSMFMGWHVFQRAAELNCKVMLNGQGGDEVLLGYERYYAAYLKSLPLGQLASESLRTVRNSSLGLAQVAAYYLYFTNPALRIARLKRRSPLRRELWGDVDFAALRESAAAFRDLDQLQLHEIGTLQLPHLLRYEDRNSMRHSIETRLPFLDYRLVEMGVSLRSNLKMRDGWTKYVLRRAMKETLPDDVAWRRSKLGFEAPEKTWLAAHEDAMIDEIRRSRIVGEIADLDRLLAQFGAMGLRDRWSWFNLAAWERVHDVQWA